MSRAIENYHRSSRQMIDGFVRNRCNLDPRACEEATPLHRAYLAWCAETGHQACTQTAFGWSLARAGFAAEKIGGKVYRRGLALRSGEKC